MSITEKVKNILEYKLPSDQFLAYVHERSIVIMERDPFCSSIIVQGLINIDRETLKAAMTELGYRFNRIQNL